LARHTQDATAESAPQVSDPLALRASGDLTEDEAVEAALARLHEAGVGPVAAATLMELAALGVDPRLSTLGAMAMELARQMDSRNSATAKSMCAGRLQDAMDRLMELNPPAAEATPLDEINARREARLAAAEDRVGSAGSAES
jgi:hypothetical protein